MRTLRPVSAILLIVLVFSIMQVNGQVSHTPLFDGESAYSFLTGQCDFGPRPPGSENLTLCRAYIVETLESFNWTVSIQNFTYRETACANIIATWNETVNSPIVLGAHYDTRPNARSRVELVFFDAEDSGGIDGWDWIRGSVHYVSELTTQRITTIEAMVLVDIVGDANLYLPKERTSTDSLQNAIWAIAADLGYSSTFVDTPGWSVTDDHKPFLDVGIPAVDIIQVPFPSYWHTLEDTPDKCSAESLEIVGEVIEFFVVGGEIPPPSDTPYVLYGTLIVIALIIIYVLYQRMKR